MVSFTPFSSKQPSVSISVFSFPANASMEVCRNRRLTSTEHCQAGREEGRWSNGGASQKQSRFHQKASSRIHIDYQKEVVIDGDFKKCARQTKELNEDQLMFTLSQVRILINEIFELHTCKNYICNIAPSLYMLIYRMVRYCSTVFHVFVMT